VTLPPPSRTTSALVFSTLAVARMTIVTGSGPQENVMMPPAATAATTAADVQLAGVPAPITCVGCAVSTGCAAAGTAAVPARLPGSGSARGAGVGLGLGDADGVGAGVGRGAAVGWAVLAAVTVPGPPPQAAKARTVIKAQKAPKARMADHGSSRR